MVNKGTAKVDKGSDAYERIRTIYSTKINFLLFSLFPEWADFPVGAFWFIVLCFSI